MRSADSARATATAAIVRGDRERQHERLPVPADHDQAAHALDQVGDRVHRGGVVEPGDAHQVPRNRHRRDEQEDEEHREEALHGLGRAGAERREDPERTEGQRDQHVQHEEDEDTGNTAREPDSDRESDDQVHGRLEQREDDGAAELAGQQGEPAHRRQREPAQEPGLDVAGEIGAGVHRREQRTLDERHGEQERDDRGGREPRQVRLCPEAARVHRKQHQREDDRAR